MGPIKQASQVVDCVFDGDGKLSKLRVASLQLLRSGFPSTDDRPRPFYQWLEARVDRSRFRQVAERSAKSPFDRGNAPGGFIDS
ncbi:MAG: hypothetical protein IH897_15855 [Planctomycetes bacterium]|nr:hypothetical protein [Planctomycetota bacterium]